MLSWRTSRVETMKKLHNKVGSAAREASGAAAEASIKVTSERKRRTKTPSSTSSSRTPELRPITELAEHPPRKRPGITWYWLQQSSGENRTTPVRGPTMTCVFPEAFMVNAGPVTRFGPRNGHPIFSTLMPPFTSATGWIFQSSRPTPKRCM